MKTFVKVLSVIFGILLVACGIYCMFTPITTSLVMGCVIGLTMVIDSIGRFVNWGEAKKEGVADGWMLTGAILSALFGFFILNSAILQVGIDAFIIYYIAIWLVLNGIIGIVRAFKIRGLHKALDTKVLGTKWYLHLITGILVLIFGILCLFNPVIVASIIGIFIGLGIIFTGASLITLATTPSN